MGTTLTAAGRRPAPPSCDSESALERAAVDLYQGHFEGLFRFAMTITRDRALAEDAIQDSFLRYFVACREGQAIRSPVAWLYRVLRNRLLDDRRRVSPDSLAVAGEGAVQADAAEGPATFFQREDIPRGLRASLSGRELECLQLRLEGLNYQEIAATLRIRPGTVGALLARALKKTRAILGQERIDR